MRSKALLLKLGWKGCLVCIGSGGFQQQHVTLPGPDKQVGLAIAIEIWAERAGGLHSHGGGPGAGKGVEPLAGSGPDLEAVLSPDPSTEKDFRMLVTVPVSPGHPARRDVLVPSMVLSFAPEDQAASDLTLAHRHEFEARLRGIEVAEGSPLQMVHSWTAILPGLFGFAGAPIDAGDRPLEGIAAVKVVDNLELPVPVDVPTEDEVGVVADGIVRPAQGAVAIEHDELSVEGDVDFIDNVPTTDIERLKNEQGIELSQGISNRVIYLHLDHKRQDSPFVKANGGGAIKNPLQDHRVRKAISKAINRDAIVDRVMEGVAIKAGQLLPEGFFGVSPNLKPEPYDPAGAKKLLAEAGVPNGFELTIHGPNDRYINDAKICEAIGQMLSRVGIRTSVETMPKSVYFNRASRGGPGKTPEFSFILVGWGAGTGEASSPLKSLLHTYDKSRGFGASNRGRYSNPEVDRMVEEALAMIDETKRQNLLAKATELAINDLGIIPLHYQVNTWAAKKGIRYKARTDETTLYSGVYTN